MFPFHLQDVIVKFCKAYFVLISESVCLYVLLSHVFLFQATQGVQVNCFRTLSDLVVGYQHPHKGLVAPLLYPVMRESEPNDESSGKMG